MSLVCACHDDRDRGTFPGITIDEEPRSDVESDGDEADTADAGSSEVDRVPAGEAFGDGGSGNDGEVRVHRVESRDQIPPGPVARARVGDVILENARARFFIAQDDASISPCPYGGNPVDAQYKRPDGEATPDILGEICPMLNIGHSMRPTAVEVLKDGSESGIGVVAVTGKAALLDFLNLRAMVPVRLRPALDRVPFDFGETPPLTMTVYYVLRPGATHLRVVTALRNDGDEEVHALFGHAVKSGGDGPGGFGYKSLSIDNVDGRPLPFLGYRGENASYGYVPDPSPRLSASLPTGGTYITISGVGVSMLGPAELSDV
ncbi:MAG: hypothetical protein ABEN55_08245, partial [Bradymonadaceae bacterium]